MRARMPVPVAEHESGRRPTGVVPKRDAASVEREQQMLRHCLKLHMKLMGRMRERMNVENFPVALLLCRWEILKLNFPILHDDGCSRSLDVMCRQAASLNVTSSEIKLLLLIAQWSVKCQLSAAANQTSRSSSACNRKLHEQIFSTLKLKTHKHASSSNSARR